MSQTYIMDPMIKIDGGLCINCGAASGLPDGLVPFGTFVIGYPAEKYQGIPVRKPVDVTWN